MISYEIVSASPQKFQIKVRLDRKHIGDIRYEFISGKYYYKVKGSNARGEGYATVDQVKKSLEG